MKIHILSDLHFEFSKLPNYVPPDCDVVILAGDISPGLPGVMWAMETFKVPVIYVAGNHEFYGMRRLHRQIEKLKDKTAGSNVHVLQNETLVIDGVRFIAATLWTDMNLFGTRDLSATYAQNGMNDYTSILMDNHQALTVIDTVREHQKSRLYIHDELTKPFEGETVVVTHHAPSWKSISEHWMHHPLTPAYASRLEDLMLDFEPKLWIHGHMHENFDYMIGNSRVVCNPRGYHGPKSHENNVNFDPGLVVEV